MAGSTDPRPPLPDWILECYECLLPQMCPPEDGSEDIQTIDRDEAVDLLLADCETPLEPEDATYALERLLNRGYFYQVDSELRLTTPEEHCSVER
ncbi:hypothetical protein ACYJ1Y_18155 [Natrialbaceae archaeon A-gly3]